MNRFYSLPQPGLVLATLGILALAGTPVLAQQVQMHVDGEYHLDVGSVHNNQVPAHADGYLYLSGSQNGLYFTIDTVVKGTNNHIEGTPTMIFDDGSTLTFYYELRRVIGTILFEGNFVIVDGTGLFEGVSGSGEICYPVDGSGNGPLMMDGVLVW
jgi:hypothetical protein